MLKQLLLISSFVGATAVAYADDLRATAISGAEEAAKVTAAVSEATTDSVYWKFPSKFGVNFGQAMFDNWAAGGTNNLNFNVYVDLNANYKKDRHMWNNNLFAEYGGMFTKDLDKAPMYEPYRKNADRLSLYSKYGYQSAKCKDLYYSALLDFKTQLVRGYEYTDTSKTQVSDFFAPANAIVSLGLDYKPNKFISVFASPLTGRFLICAKDSGEVETYVPGQDDPVISKSSLKDKAGFTKDKDGDYNFGGPIEPSLGAYLCITNDFDIVENIHLKSKLDFFSAYANGDGFFQHQHFGCHTVVNWDMLLTMKVTKYITTSLRTQFAYDHNVVFEKTYTDENGETAVRNINSRRQFMDQFNLGFAYAF